MLPCPRIAEKDEKNEKEEEGTEARLALDDATFKPLPPMAPTLRAAGTATLPPEVWESVWRRANRLSVLSATAGRT